MNIKQIISKFENIFYNWQIISNMVIQIYMIMIIQK